MLELMAACVLICSAKWVCVEHECVWLCHVGENGQSASRFMVASSGCEATVLLKQVMKSPLGLNDSSELFCLLEQNECVGIQESKRC